MIEMIVATGLDGAIGKDNKLLWDLKDDLKHFAKITKGRTVVMGWNTWESLPNGPLKGRKNIVITRKKKDSYALNDGTTVLFISYDTFQMLKIKDYVVIGGSQIYELFKANVEKIYVTLVFGIFPEADTHIPTIGPAEWKVNEKAFYPADERNSHPFYITEVTRR